MVSTPTTTARSAPTISMTRPSAAGYLCFRGKDLATPAGWMNALRAYNHSDQYARAARLGDSIRDRAASLTDTI